MATETAAPAIRFEGVTKSYGDGPPAVDDVDLDIRGNAVTVLVGSSGCGKTTLLRMINRMVEPTSGRVLIGGEDVADRDPVQLRRGIGYVMQNGGLLPHRTVADNVATVPRLNGVSKKDARARAMELIELVGLDASVADRYPSQLSGGQQQRVGVARALAADSVCRRSWSAPSSSSPTTSPRPCSWATRSCCWPRAAASRSNARRGN